MIVIENDKEYQQRSPSGFPQFRDIALRRRLADMLKRNEFTIDGEYHVFQKTQKFPVLKIKTSLISHFCFKITGDEPAAKKKKVIAEEEDSEDEFLVTSFYEDVEMDIDDRKSLPDASEIEIQEEKPKNSSEDAGSNPQNVSPAFSSIIITLIQEWSRTARKYRSADYRRTCLKLTRTLPRCIILQQFIYLPFIFKIYKFLIPIIISR